MVRGDLAASWRAIRPENQLPGPEMVWQSAAVPVGAAG
jgi:hypothetical protein